MSRQDVRGAAEHLQRAIALDPRSAALRREIAVAYGTLNFPGEALTQIQQACQLDPDNAEYQYLLGLSYAEVGRIGPAAGALERAVQLYIRVTPRPGTTGTGAKKSRSEHYGVAGDQQTKPSIRPTPISPMPTPTILAQHGRTGGTPPHSTPFSF